jgi:hypothetical protein
MYHRYLEYTQKNAPVKARLPAARTGRGMLTLAALFGIVLSQFRHAIANTYLFLDIPYAKYYISKEGIAPE